MNWKYWIEGEGLIVIILFAAAFAYFISRIPFGINLYDEGIVLIGANSLLKGLVPYKDFWYVYTPGNLYFLAFFFRIFGPSILLARILSSIISLFIVICTYKIVKDLVPDKISVLISLIMITLWLGMSGTFKKSALPVLFILLSCIFIFRYVDNKQRNNLIIAGILTGIIAFFRHDFFLYQFLSISLILILLNYKHYSNLQYGRLRSLISSLKIWILYGAVTVLTILPLLVYFLAVAPLPDLLSQFVTFPTQIYAEYRYLPYQLPNLIPSPTIQVMVLLERVDNIIAAWIPYYFSLFIFLVYIVVSLMIVYKLIKGKFGSKEDWSIFLLLLLGLFLLNHAKVRFDLGHLFSTMIMAIILFSYLCSDFFKLYDVFKPHIRTKKPHIKIKPFSNFLKIFLVYLVLTSFFICCVYPLQKDMQKTWTPLGLERGEGIYVTQQEDFISAVKFIKQKTPLNDKIFVGNSRHDRIRVNYVLFYFLAQRDSGTRYFDLHPGVVTTPLIQQEIIGDLQKNNVTYLVLWDEGNETEPNKSNQSSSITDLDVYIENKYDPIKTFGKFTIYELKNQ